MFKRLVKMWSDWLGDRDLEIAIRKELARLGHNSKIALIRQSRLEAIERPGWVQVWSFSVEYERADGVDRLFGTARDDGRSGTKVFISSDSRDRNQQLAQWCEGLIRRVDRGIR